MAVQFRQLERYFKPVLRLGKFRINDLNGMLSETQKKDLMLARAFSDRSMSGRQEASEFAKELKRARPELRDPIEEEISKAQSKSSIRHSDRIQLQKSIQRIFADNGISADFARPNSVGIILRTTETDGIPTHFVLCESSGSNPFTGRFNVPDENDPGSIYLNVTGAVARMNEQMKLLFYDTLDGSKDGERLMMYFGYHVVWEEAEHLKSLMQNMHFKLEDQHPSAMFGYFARRKFAMRLLAMMEQSETAPDFFLKALNSYLDCTRSHETAHLLERMANKGEKFDNIDLEVMAYLMQAAYSHPDVPFINLAEYLPFGIDKVFPKVWEDMTSRGPDGKTEPYEFFFRGRHYLKKLAREAFPVYFEHVSNKPSSIIDGSRIEAVNTADHISKEHIPIIREALCFTDARGRHKATG